MYQSIVYRIAPHTTVTTLLLHGLLYNELCTERSAVGNAWRAHTIAPSCRPLVCVHGAVRDNISRVAHRPAVAATDICAHINRGVRASITHK